MARLRRHPFDAKNPAMMKLAEFWPQCLSLLAAELTEQQFDFSIAPLTVSEEDGAWVVYAKTQFAANLLRSQYGAKLAQARELLAPDAPPLLIKVGSGTRYPFERQAAKQPENAEPTPSAAQPASSKDASPRTAQEILDRRMSNLRPAKKSAAENVEKSAADSGKKTPPASAIEQAKADADAKQRHKQTNLSSDYTFESLVEGKGNHLAVAVAKSIAEKPGDDMYNPFFVYGSTGLGKTHLAQAVGHELLRINPAAQVLYIHANDYVNTFVAAVRQKNWDSFKQQYLRYQLLIIDDIQFIQGKDRTMEEFFLLFEHFHSRNQQIILTCDQLPSSLENMEQRLVSRFSWGMTLKLEPPELEMRVDILERKAADAGIRLEEDAVLFIAQNVKQNVRELEGALNRLIARCRFDNVSLIDMDMVTDTLTDIIAHNYKPITVELIMKAVADYYHIRIADLTGKKRNRNFARPRQMAMAIAKELTSLSLPAIGEAFGGRDHTTVIHGVKNITKLRDEDPETKKDYEKLLILVQN